MLAMRAGCEQELDQDHLAPVLAEEDLLAVGQRRSKFRGRTGNGSSAERNRGKAQRDR